VGGPPALWHENRELSVASKGINERLMSLVTASKLKRAHDYFLDTNALWTDTANSEKHPQSLPGLIPAACGVTSTRVFQDTSLLAARSFIDLDAVIRLLEQGQRRLAAHTESLRSLTAWHWIVKLNLNAY
jgi:hypothetical protein